MGFHKKASRPSVFLSLALEEIEKRKQPINLKVFAVHKTDQLSYGDDVCQYLQSCCKKTDPKTSNSGVRIKWFDSSKFQVLTVLLL